ncbi:transcriptional regulator TyrR [Salmonella enterica subsp. enterica serovar Infantis]|nr:transcriptional regulator TyrR [Salmonella enterica subsp. enterica serovar Infantis]
MRLEVFCEDRLGLTRELLDLLVLRSIDLRGIEIDPIGRIYLNFAELEFTDFSSLMAEIRRISGVTDVRTVPWMPSEREHLALSAFSQIIAVSAKMKHVVEQARKLAMLSAPLLITGDTGTGKDLFAYACHQASPRSAKPYLALNCASIPEDAVESELFGHAPEGKKGFFEQANGGSVLLDEIGEMSPRMQAKLLRFLNDGTFRRVGEDHEIHVDVRVICATQKNLVELVQKGLFREDLYYRLNVLTLNLPPLRDCPQDIMPLTELFVARFADEQGVPRPKLSADLSTVLTRYGWPGNVRQLKNAIYRALTQLEGYELRPQDILLPDYDAATVAVGEDAMEGSLDDITSRFERSVLTQLYRSYPSTRKLAKRLGVSHTAIANKLREYGLSQKKGEE